MKLNLGCGNKYLGNDWIHIDICKTDIVDIEMDITNLDKFETNSINEIYVCHVFEHFRKKYINNILNEWFRVLAPNGILRIAVPDFENIAKLYVSGKYDIQIFSGLINGGQKNDYDIHYNIYDEKYITKLLKDTGFTDIQRYDWKDFLPENYDDYSRAYIPHMDFENGTLVSLNICAKK
jgi:predicted SAM-dependent methyltransferase